MTQPLPPEAGTPGRVIFIGAGPGAADLITLRGARALAQASVVLFDALTDPALRELAPQAHWVDVGKRGFVHGTAQDRINALLVQHALTGVLVARLKGGDPSIFGRLEEELEALMAHGIAFEVIPGVTSALAAAAFTGRPLTRRGLGRSVSLATAMTHERVMDVGQRTSPRADTEVFYMAGRQLAALSRQLFDAGWPGDTPVLAVSRAGWPDQCVSEHSVASLDSACTLHAGRPTVITVGVGAGAVQPCPQPQTCPDSIAGHQAGPGVQP